MELVVYQYEACGYCQRVLRAIEDLGIAGRVELRDTLREPGYREELVAARGRATVPVLRIQEAGEVRWMGESAAIVAWLYDRFGEGRRAPTRALNASRVMAFAMWTLLGAGMVLSEYQAGLWFGALALGAVRAGRNWWRTRAWFHAAIAAVFLVACAATGLRALHVADLPWWYFAYGLTGVLFAASLLRRRPSPS